MESKVKFTSKQIANWKRTAMNVNANVIKRDKLAAKIAALQKECDEINQDIELEEAHVRRATGGYSTSDIFVKKVVETGKTDPKTGYPVKQTRYELIYPETIVPPCENKDANDAGKEVENEAPAAEAETETPENENNENNAE